MCKCPICDSKYWKISLFTAFLLELLTAMNAKPILTGGLNRMVSF